MRAPILVVLLVALISISTSLLVWPVAHAASRLTDDLTELSKLADAIAEVEVLEQGNSPKGLGGAPSTLVTVVIRRSYKGTPAKDEKLTLEYPGGSDGEHIMFASGQPKLVKGQSAVLLLVHPEGATTWRVIGGSVGQINLEVDENGQLMARRESGQFDYFVGNKSSLTGYMRVTTGTVTAAQCDELLRTILKTGKPVIETPTAGVPVPPAANGLLPAEAKQTTGGGPVRFPLTWTLFAAVAILAILWQMRRK